MPFLAEKFWKPVDQSDALAIAGLVLGIGSIWLSWWLARRDIRKRLRDAERRVAVALLSVDAADLIRCAREVRDSVSRRDWDRAVIRLEDVAQLVSRLRENKNLPAELTAEIGLAADEIRSVLTALGKRRDGDANWKLSEPRRLSLDTLVESLTRIDSKIRNQLSEGTGGN
jgi:hypothetical protein